MNIEIDFMDAVNGATKTVSFGRTDVCETCFEDTSTFRSDYEYISVGLALAHA